MAVFSRNVTTGALTFVEAQRDGIDAVDGLGGAWAVVLSPDGAHVYVAGRYDAALAVFTRTPTTGALSFVEVQRDGIGGVDGLSGAWSVAVSPDGTYVYAGGSIDNALAVFRRDATTGALTFIEAQRDGVAGVNGLGGAAGVTVSPDGAQVYVGGFADNAVALFQTKSLGVPGLDPFKCYQEANGVPPFLKRDVALEDRFASHVATVVRPQRLCSPAHQNGAAVADPTTHLEGYMIEPTTAASHPALLATVGVVNLFGEIFVHTRQPDRLLVPSAKDLQSPPSPPDRGGHGVDHYQCYGISIVKTNLCAADAPQNPQASCTTEADCGGIGGATGFCFSAPAFVGGVETVVEDQFTSRTAFTVRRPTSFCTPVNQDGKGIKNPDIHLLCYKLKRSRKQCTGGAPQTVGAGCRKEEDCGATSGVTHFCVRPPRFQRVGGVHTSNELGAGVVDLNREDELCVPSVIE